MTHTVYGLDYETIADVREYREASSLIDRLSDAGFPIENTRIIGVGLHSVEQVTGRMTVGKAALLSSAGGAGMGLMVGLLMMIFLQVPALGVLATSVAMGGVFGALLGAFDHAMTRGRRDFTSISTTKASKYEIQVLTGLAEQAQAILRIG